MLQASQQAFPIIALIARDILPIPRASVSVKWLFSKSRHLCDDLRSSLKVQTISEAMLVKVWIKSRLLEY